MTAFADLAHELDTEPSDRATFELTVRRASEPNDRYWIRTQLAGNLEMLAEAERIWREIDAGIYDDSCPSCDGHGCDACDGSGKRAA